MKNLFKSKKIYAFLLTMIMFMSLFLFSACGEDDEKLLFKIVYRPYADSRSEFFGSTYKEKIKEDLDITTEFVITYVVGAFGIGEVQIEQENKETGKYETVKLRPETPDEEEYYYSDLLGIDINNRYYSEVVSKIIQITNVYYEYISGSGVPPIMVLSNYRLTETKLHNDIVKYDEEEGAFIAQTSLQRAGSNASVSYNKPLDDGEIYYYDDSDGYSYIFVGGSVNGGGTYNSERNASRFVTSLLSTNYNNIQQTVGNVDVSNGDSGIYNSSGWEYSLTQNEMNNVYDAQDYLETYMDKYFDDYKIEIVNAILTRSENELNDELERKYNLAKRRNITAAQKKAYVNDFIDAACEYIDHLGLIPEEVETITTFLTETAMGYNVTVTDAIKKSCIKCLTSAQVALSYVPLLEVLSYKGSELEEVEIDGYIQSIIILRDDETYNFTDLIAIFTLEENQIIEPYLVTVRHQENGEINEYPIAISEESVEEAMFEISMGDILENDEGLEISKSSDPIKAGLFSKKTSIVDEAKTYAKMFTYSTSTENTDGMCWCFNDENSNFIQIIFATNSLCLSQHLDIDILIF